VDATAIDSTVLETELLRHPELAGQVRIIESFGPSPIPPWVMQTNLPAEVKAGLRKAFSQMHTTEAGRTVLAKGQIDHFDLVSDPDYESIRQMAEIAKQVTLE
jgi:phosphonate transport system substrate-binding protein